MFGWEICSPTSESLDAVDVVTPYWAHESSAGCWVRDIVIGTNNKHVLFIGISLSELVIFELFSWSNCVSKW